MEGLAATVVKHAFTERDNATFCPLRIVAVVGIAVFLGLAVVNWRHFDPQNYGIGFGATVGALGAAIRWKASTEAPAS